MKEMTLGSKICLTICLVACVLGVTAGLAFMWLPNDIENVAGKLFGSALVVFAGSSCAGGTLKAFGPKSPDDEEKKSAKK